MLKKEFYLPILPEDFMQKFIITGASSFIGRHLLDELGQDHAIKVLSSKRDYPDFFNVANITVHTGNLLDKNSLSSFVETDSTVINLAYLWQESQEQNLQAIENLATLCVKNNIKRFIHCSTTSVYGNIKTNMVDENSFCAPQSQYAKTKLALEKHLLENYRDKFEIAILRPTQVFGAYGKNLLKLANDLKNGSSLKNYMKSCLMAKRNMNLVSVKNVVSAIKFLAQAKHLQEKIFIISDDESEPRYYADIEAYLMQQLAIKNYNIPVLPLPLFIYKSVYKFFKKEDINPRTIYINKNLENMGFVKAAKFADGLASFISWYTHT